MGLDVQQAALHAIPYRGHTFNVTEPLPLLEHQELPALLRDDHGSIRQERHAPQLGWRLSDFLQRESIPRRAHDRRVDLLDLQSEAVLLPRLAAQRKALQIEDPAAFDAVEAKLVAAAQLLCEADSMAREGLPPAGRLRSLLAQIPPRFADSVADENGIAPGLVRAFRVVELDAANTGQIDVRVAERASFSEVADIRDRRFRRSHQDEAGRAYLIERLRRDRRPEACSIRRLRVEPLRERSNPRIRNLAAEGRHASLSVAAANDRGDLLSAASLSFGTSGYRERRPVTSAAKPRVIRLRRRRVCVGRAQCKERRDTESNCDACLHTNLFRE